MPVTIDELPEAGPLVGTEPLETIQDGVSAQTTVEAVSTFAPGLTAEFVTLTTSINLPNERILAVEGGVLTLTDGGAGNSVTLGVASGGITTAKIDNLAITNAKIGPLAVDTDQLAAQSVTLTNMALNSVGTGQIVTGAVTQNEMNLLSVGTAQLINFSVTNSKIGGSAVTNAKLDDMAEARIKGRASGAGTGSPVDLTGAEVATILGNTAFSNLILTDTSPVNLIDDDNALNLGGVTTSAHMAFDAGDIQAKSSATNATDISINRFGGDIQLGGVAAANIFIDNNGEVTIDRAGGLQKLATEPTGIGVRGALNNAPGGSQDSIVRFRNIGGTSIGAVGFTGTFLYLVSENDGGGVILQADDTGGTLRYLFRGDPDDTVQLYYAGASVARTATAATGGFEVNNTLTGAGFERVITTSDLNENTFSNLILNDTDAVDLTDDNNALNLGGATSSTHMAFDRNTIQAKGSATTALAIEINPFGGDIQLGNTSSANILIDSDGEIVIERAGGLRKFTTGPNGVNMYGSSTNAVGGTQNTRVQLTNLNGIVVGSLGFYSSTDLTFTSDNHGGLLILQGEDTGGTNRLLFQGDPDSNTQLYQVGTSVARTNTAANGGLEINNTSTGSGWERALTTSDLGAIFLTARKASDTTRASTTTLVDDPDLVITTPSTGSYLVEGYLLYNATSDSVFGDLKLGFGFTGTSSSTGTGVGFLRYLSSSSSAAPEAAVVFNSSTINGGAGSSITDIASGNGVRAIVYNGVLEVTAVGDFSIHWAQASSQVTGTVMRAGSYLRMTEI